MGDERRREWIVQKGTGKGHDVGAAVVAPESSGRGKTGHGDDVDDKKSGCRKIEICRFF